ncbi:hypothetical protein V1264_022252 [Littorina saxatilis]|uniref:Uncharacterized protein n=1 Tax=Littorina saxatilis TaxID=31220 RepID=A0AAN9FX33_9CAEN
MTTTTATLRMLLLICISLGQIRLVTMQSTNVPETGVYLITMVADPDGRTDMFLQLNGRDAGFVAYGQGDAVAGLVVAVHLKAGTRVSARYTGNTQGATSLGVGFVSYGIRFITMRCTGQSSGNVVKFDRRFQSKPWKWTPYFLTAEHIKILTSGIYWVAARPDCGNGTVILDIGPGLFDAFCDGDKAVSASGAFYLKAGRKLIVTFKSGSYLQGGTSFSYVMLDGNQQKYIKHTNHIAFTAWTDNVGGHLVTEWLSFNKAKATDYGSLYNYAQRIWTIPTTGSYIVSMRGDPGAGRNTLKVIFYKNNKTYLFAWYNKNRTKSGQAGVFQFTKGDKLFMVNDFGSYVGKETFMSIALLWVASE